RPVVNEDAPKNHYALTRQSLRVAKAGLSAQVSGTLERLAQVLMLLFFIPGIVSLVFKIHQALILLGFGSMIAVFLVWLRRDLRQLPEAPIGSTTALDQLLPLAIAARYKDTMTAAEFWAMLAITDD